MYPSERYAHLTWDIPEDAKARIIEYVDESYTQGTILAELECRTWREVIVALIRYEHNGTYSSQHEELINDYKLYKEHVPRATTGSEVRDMSNAHMSGDRPAIEEEA